MTNFSAADVKRLRDATGAGMMDSKKALEEAEGDFDKAVEVLRIKGGKKVQSRGETRVAANGLVAAAEGAMIELASETDFVAKNEQFQTLAGDIVAHFGNSSATDVPSLLAETLRDGRTVAENIDALAAVIGEKLELRRAVKLDGQVATYLHKKASDLPAQVGVLVQFTGDDLAAARGAAMQVAAMRPRYLTIRPLRGRAGLTSLDPRRIGQDRQGRHTLSTPREGRPPMTEDVAAVAFSRSVTSSGVASSSEAVTSPVYRRVLLKLSGEVFGGGSIGVDPDVAQSLARQIAEVVVSGVQVAVVVGGGNFFRGAELQQRGMDRDRADYMGMLGTVMNCLALQDFLEKAGIPTRVQTAITMGQVAEPYIPRRAERHLEKGRVVIFGAGAGLPYFSTDTVAAQRALEIGCQVLLLAKFGVDGVYDADPRTHPEAVKFDTISYDEVIQRGLEVADAAAFSLCRDNAMPVVVFELADGNIARAARGEKIGTLVNSTG